MSATSSLALPSTPRDNRPRAGLPARRDIGTDRARLGLQHKIRGQDKGILKGHPFRTPRPCQVLHRRKQLSGYMPRCLQCQRKQRLTNNLAVGGGEGELGRGERPAPLDEVLQIDGAGLPHAELDGCALEQLQQGEAEPGAALAAEQLLGRLRHLWPGRVRKAEQVGESLDVSPRHRGAVAKTLSWASASPSAQCARRAVQMRAIPQLVRLMRPRLGLQSPQPEWLRMSAGMCLPELELRLHVRQALQYIGCMTTYDCRHLRCGPELGMLRDIHSSTSQERQATPTKTAEACNAWSDNTPPTPC